MSISVQDSEAGAIQLGPRPADRRARSFMPPGELRPEQVPQFVVLGFDDNQISGLETNDRAGAMTWALDMLATRNNPGQPRPEDPWAGKPLTASFYCSSAALNDEGPDAADRVRHVWRRAMAEGHELGNHSHDHPHGTAFSVNEWRAQMQLCNRLLTRGDMAGAKVSKGRDRGLAGAGLDAANLVGFRTPYLEYAKHTLDAAHLEGFHYDCSIEDGFQDECHGGRLPWPYTLDEGSAGHDHWVARGERSAIGQYPALWELPAHPVIVPEDHEAQRYGVRPGLRARCRAVEPGFCLTQGKITGFDYNLWVSHRLNPTEFTATLAHSLQLRLSGNRAPMLLGAHTDYYCEAYTDAPHTTAAERRRAFEAFVDRALRHQDVRFVSAAELLGWLRQPRPLPGT